MPRLIDRFSEIAGDFDVLLCDVWGVIHNGVAAWPSACDALQKFRAGGGAVVLITNAPRPSSSVAEQLDRLHVPQDAYDAIVSSGDVTRHTIEAHADKPIWHLGPARDAPIFDGLNVTFSNVEQSGFIVCTGLFDDTTETPENYRAVLSTAKARSLGMVCANPDLVVERGEDLVYCAGALAELYREMGGNVLFAGKPHAAIYDEALSEAAKRRGKPADKARVLAIGDSVRTDLEGANANGLACLFVTAGIHANEFGARNKPDVAALTATLQRASKMPLAVTPRLSW